MSEDAPLAGITVVALEQAVAMPFCTWVLAELGADVVKIERPGAGDVIRGWDSAVRGLSTGYVWLNGGKRDLAVDLSGEDGRQVVRRLAGAADVFVENFAPGVAARLGLDATRLCATNPQLVYCSLSGYGQTGPYRDVKAYDLLVQGEAGILLSNGTPDEPAKVGLPATDMIGGTTAALGILAALLRRGTTGVGTCLDVGMFDSVLPWLGYFPQHYWHGGAEPPRTGMRHQYLCPYGPYPAADDRYVNLAVANAADWRKLCVDVLERPGWVDDPRFARISARTAHRSELEPMVEQVVARRPSEYWLDRLSAAGLAHGTVRTIREVLDHPQARHRNMLVEADSPVGALPVVRFPLAPTGVRRRVPALGEHTDQVLTDLGYSDREIARLRAAGTIS